MKLSVKTALLILSASILAIFAQSVCFDFTNWDDPAYITQNNIIKTFDFNFLSHIFSRPMHGHYHPLTWISIAFDYQLFGLNAWGFHLHNLLLHFVNTFLVFYFIRLIKNDIRIAFFTALLFAVHPFAHESVSWVTERKNLLFALFYFAGLISYIQYSKNKKTLLYVVAFIFFLLSLLSKGSAITFPLILTLWLYYNHSFSKKEFAKLIPFFLFTLLFAWIAFKAQQPLLNQITVKLSLSHSILYSSWAFGLYVIKAFIPFNTAAFHPIYIESLPAYYYIGFLVLAVFIFAIIKTYKLKEKSIVFGLLFFIINIILFLKIFEAYASSYFMAERYTYIAFVGLYFAFFSWFFDKTAKIMWSYLLIIWIMVISIISFNYAKTWKNSLTLWNNVLKIYPSSHVALLNYGNALRQDRQYSKAIENYNKISNQGDVFYTMLENRAFVYYKTNQWDKAANDYALLLEKYPKRKDIKQNIVNIFISKGDLTLAYHHLRFLLTEDSTFCDAWNSLGNYYSQINNFDSSLWAYNKALKCNPKALYYYNRATLYSMNNSLKEAMVDFDKAIAIDSSQAEYFVNRAITYFKMKNFTLSLNDFNHAIRLDSQNIDYYLNRCNVFIALNQWNNAILDITKALSLNPYNGDVYAQRSFAYNKLGITDKACNDIQKALQLGYKKYETWAKQICK